MQTTRLPRPKACSPSGVKPLLLKRCPWIKLPFCYSLQYWAGKYLLEIRLSSSGPRARQYLSMQK